MISQKSCYVGAVVAAAFLLLGGLFAASVIPQATVRASGGLASDLGVWQSSSLGPLSGSSFSFGAAGDYSFGSEAQAVMSSMGSAGLDFAIALGDFSYGATSPDNWCNFYESRVGDGHAILIVGNHDTGEIDTFRQYCNFGIDAPMSGDYAKEYYFDYPRSSPLARFILTSQGTLGSDQTGFVSDAIDSARAAGIPWVIVGMHKVCISTAEKSCEIGEAFMDMLLSKKVDLVLEGHAHNYQRTKLLTCADDGLFRPECVADADSDFAKSAGTVINIVGTGGQSPRSIGTTEETPYFAMADATTNGFLKVTLTATRLDARFVAAARGSFVDSYSISSASTPPPPDFSLSASPTSVSFTAGQSAPTTIQVQPTNGYAGTVDLAVSSSPAGVDGGCSPPSLPGGGTATCVLTSSTAGQYTVTVTGTGGSVVHTTTVAVVVNAPAPGPDTTPPSITITSPANQSAVDSSPVTIRGVASDDVALAKVEWKSEGSTWSQATGTGSWSAVVPLDEGPHTIYVRATDTAGNEFVATISLVVHTNPGVPAQPGDTAPRLFGIRVFPTLVGVAAGLIGLAAAIALVARSRRNHR